MLVLVRELCSDETPTEIYLCTVKRRESEYINIQEQAVIQLVKLY